MATQTLARGADGKYQAVPFASAARALAQTYTSDTFITPYGKTLTLVVNVTTGAATPAVTPRLVGLTAGGIAYTVLSGAQITSTSAAVVMMRVGAGVAEVANLGTAVPLPGAWYVEVVHGDTDSLTYSVSAEVV